MQKSQTKVPQVHWKQEAEERAWSDLPEKRAERHLLRHLMLWTTMLLVVHHLAARMKRYLMQHRPKAATWALLQERGQVQERSIGRQRQRQRWWNLREAQMLFRHSAGLKAVVHSPSDGF